MAEDRLVRRVHDGIPEGKRHRGRPMKRWRDALEYTGHRPIRREEEVFFSVFTQTSAPLTSGSFAERFLI